jgi:hypothetical protein
MHQTCLDDFENGGAKAAVEEARDVLRLEPLIFTIDYLFTEDRAKDGHHHMTTATHPRNRGFIFIYYFINDDEYGQPHPR